MDRVRVTFDDEGHSQELPFVVGFIGNLAGEGGASQTPLSDRRVVEVGADESSIQALMSSLRPALTIPVPTGVEGEDSDIELQFRSLEDFHPLSIVQRVAPLQVQLARRQQQRNQVASLASGSVESIDGERAVAEADHQLRCLVDAILHHPSFQRLESTWRGLSLIANTVNRFKHQVPAQEEWSAPDVKLRVIHATKEELYVDFRRSMDFDQSALWKLIYEREFGTAGGQPFGILLSDFEFTNTHSDVKVLREIAQIGAASLAPFVAAVSPEVYELQDFGELHNSRRKLRLMDDEFIQWRNLRRSDESRFLGLTAPRVLMRLPYRAKSETGLPFPYTEDVSAATPQKYLWGSAVYALGVVVVRAFYQTGWFEDIGGRGTDNGAIDELPMDFFSTEAAGIAGKSSTDTILDVSAERKLSGDGFVPLMDSAGGGHAFFDAMQSLHIPKRVVDPTEAATIKMNAMLNYLLCTSRFGHYLKIMARRLMGQMDGPQEVQSRLNAWITKYVATAATLKSTERNRFPLRRASVNVVPTDAEEAYDLVFHITPHAQVDDIDARIDLTTRIVTA